MSDIFDAFGQRLDPQVLMSQRGPGQAAQIAGWWNDTNGLGQDRSGEMPPSEGSIIQVAGVDRLGSPAPYTVSLHASYRFGEAANCALVARIEFGAGASYKTVECDFAPGAQMAIAASGNVRITAKTVRQYPAQPYNAAGTTFTVGGSIGHTTGAHPQPYLTQRLGPILQNLTSGIITPPTWAEAVQMQLVETSEDVTDPYVAAVQLQFIDPQNNVMSVVPSDRFPQSFIPIPLAARVRVRNGVENESRTPTLIWRLAL